MPSLGNHAGAALISVRLLVVDRTVYFDAQPCRGAIEVEDEGANGVLA
jgi:hypothetical protein